MEVDTTDTLESSIAAEHIISKDTVVAESSQSTKTSGENNTSPDRSSELQRNSATEDMHIEPEDSTSLPNKPTFVEPLEKPAIENTEGHEPDSNFEKPMLESFKKPALLIGPRRGKPGKLRALVNTEAVPALCEDAVEKEQSIENIPAGPDSTTDLEKVSEPERNKSNLPPVDVQKEKQIPLPYKEPAWGGLPEREYKMEVLKSGVILEVIDLTKKSFYVFGRLPNCDIPLAHPTISRYHAVIQYRFTEDEKNPRGLYLYDLGSTHGSFWNGNRLRPNMYVRLRGGHMVRFGCSQRKFILQGPPEDEEEESELTVTELKEKRKLVLEERERKEKELKLKEEEEERLRKEKEERDGIDWGMGEDADEETDLTENPYAATNNEELFLEDPKKTLRGWFEREGYELQYETEEKGIGQFLCWVELPIDSVSGRLVRAEALVKGKKKESVIQCALEACRILDRHGVLRQANHEARKRKTRNWEEEDFYDSDEDNFLDRTGAVEKKRQQRMKMAGKLEETVETYASLLEKHKEVVKKITSIEKNLQSAQKKNMNSKNADEDELDAFMSNLSSAVSNKSEITKLKLELIGLRKEESRLINLVNIAKPANLPPLRRQNSTETADTSEKSRIKSSIMVGNRKKFKSLANKNANMLENPTASTAVVHAEEEDEDNDDETENESVSKAEDTNTKLMESYKASLTAEVDVKNSEDRVEDQMNTSDEVTKKESLDPEEIEKLEIERQEREDKEAERKKKRNLKRMHQRLDKAEKEKQKGYEEDMFKEDYSMWVPPQDQSGDGKTNLNDKFGY